jgi:hypothetical protein
MWSSNMDYILVYLALVIRNMKRRFIKRRNEKIKYLKDLGYKQDVIAERFSLSRTMISRILSFFELIEE